MVRTMNAVMNNTKEETNMTKMEYAQAVAEQIERTTVYTAEAKETVKNNGILLTGVQINDGTGISPQYYIDKPYENGVTIEEVTEEIIKYHNNAPDLPYDTEVIKSFETAKGLIQPRLISQVNDVSNFPHKEFIDMYIIYTISFSAEASAKITNQIMEEWGVTVDEIDAAARQNIRPEMMTMAEMLSSLGFPMPMDQAEMYVITNENRTYGASSILSPEIIDRFERDMYIIPSSVHELIAVPAGDLMAMELGNMIKEVNQTEVLPEEILGDDPYFFEYETKEIRKAV